MRVKKIEHMNGGISNKQILDITDIKEIVPKQFDLYSEYDLISNWYDKETKGLSATFQIDSYQYKKIKIVGTTLVLESRPLSMKNRFKVLDRLEFHFSRVGCGYDKTELLSCVPSSLEIFDRVLEELRYKRDLVVQDLLELLDRDSVRQLDFN